MKRSEQLEFLELIAARLEAAKIAYMMTGSMAMTFYSVPRMTRDVDIVIECSSSDLDVLVSLFATDCYVERTEVRDAIANGSMFNIVHNEWLVKADFIPRKNEEYRRVEFSRRRRIRVQGGTVWVVAPEDLILSKLHWAKGTNSEMQQRDVQALVHAVQPLDWGYMKMWAAKLDISDELERARRP